MNETYSQTNKVVTTITENDAKLNSLVKGSEEYNKLLLDQNKIILDFAQETPSLYGKLQNDNGRLRFEDGALEKYQSDVAVSKQVAQISAAVQKALEADQTAYLQEGRTSVVYKSWGKEKEDNKSYDEIIERIYKRYIDERYGSNQEVLKDIASNVIDEAIVVLKPNICISEKIEKNDKMKDRTVLEEAENVVKEYISQMQKKEEMFKNY